MIDRQWEASLIAGMICGGGFSVACVATALFVFVPIGRTDWYAFSQGFATILGSVFSLLGAIAFITWKTT
jgi:hypothetical protein